MAMQYVFNPDNRQINPVTAQTIADVKLRDKVISAELYALVCKGKVSVSDIAALFAVGKSPEVLVKKHTAVKESPQNTAPDNKATVKEEAPPATDPDKAGGESSVTAAFDGRELTKKTQDELAIIAETVDIDVAAMEAPTRGNLIKAIMAKAKEAEDGTPAAQ